MDVSNDIDVETVDQVLIELFWLFPTAIDQLLRSSHDLGTYSA